MEHYKVTFEPERKTISIHAGATILEAAGQAGIVLNAVCGGAGTCGKCNVTLVTESEDVLACQYHIQSDITVLIPTGSRFFEQRILTHGSTGNVSICPPVLNRFPDIAGSGQKVFGVAVDIGTTTVVAKLINLSDGNCIATSAASNPQIAFGDDVISRIAYAETESGLNKLHKTIILCINSLIDDLCKQGGITSDSVYEVVVAGNTTMNHLFLKLPVKQLGQAPYLAYSTDAHDCNPDKLGIDINCNGNIHTIENIAGFVGSDTTAVAVAVGMDDRDEMTLVIDIGTNGELILGTKNKMFSASCAAGPALEGARISQGSRAVDGSIEAVVINGDDIGIDVIGNSRPQSICGSGLIDAVAVMLELGLIEQTGRMVEKDSLKGKISPQIFERIVEKDGETGFVIAPNQDTNYKPVMLTQRDIREMQLANAAIRAGIKLLQKKAQITDDDIKHVLLAGAFGNYIRPESALRIGLLPNVDLQKIQFVGNAAASGAQMVLVNQDCRQLAGRLTEKIEYIEIAHDLDFQMVFAECLLFPVR